jgi:hypothetical protein
LRQAIDALPAIVKCLGLPICIGSIGAAIFLDKSSTVIFGLRIREISWDRGRLARLLSPKRAVGTALPMDALGTGIDLNVTNSGRTHFDRCDADDIIKSCLARYDLNLQLLGCMIYCTLKR